MNTHLVLFRRDLRVHDNKTLKTAVEESDQIIPLYVFDDKVFTDGLFGLDKVGSKRRKFYWESVKTLDNKIKDLGGKLMIESGNTIDIIRDIINKYNIDKIHFQNIPSTEEIELENRIKNSFNIDVDTYWTHTLYHIDDLPTKYSNIEDTFTPWRKEVQHEAYVREPIEKPDKIDTVEFNQEDSIDKSYLNISDNIESDLSFIKFRGGEKFGLNRLNNYIWEKDKLREYKQTRNKLYGSDYSSKFSPWLANGCLSPKIIYNEIKEYEEKRVSNDSTYWLIFELMWRDFFQFQFMKHGHKFFLPTGIRDINKNWLENEKIFTKWSKGKTGIPFVDSNMRELNKTGYMSNRGRQNVASFLVDVLGIDWRMGAAYFEEQLIDYDVCSNWGNWAYIAGVGNDSRDDRYFNVLKQSKKYDENGKYIRYWIPEIDNLPAEATHEPWLLNQSQQSIYGVQLGEDYPEPMIDIKNKQYDELVKN